MKMQLRRPSSSSSPFSVPDSFLKTTSNCSFITMFRSSEIVDVLILDFSVNLLLWSQVMTPSTVKADFVSAVLDAGYYVELAGGGHYNATAFLSKVVEIQKQIPAGVGITLNSLYTRIRPVPSALEVLVIFYFF